MAFLASKTGDGEDEILSLHGGLTLNIQKQLEVNFKQLITGVLVINIPALCLLFLVGSYQSHCCFDSVV